MWDRLVHLEPLGSHPTINGSKVPPPGPMACRGVTWHFQGPPSPSPRAGLPLPAPQLSQSCHRTHRTSLPNLPGLSPCLGAAHKGGHVQNPGRTRPNQVAVTLRGFPLWAQEPCPAAADRRIMVQSKADPLAPWIQPCLQPTCLPITGNTSVWISAAVARTLRVL